MKTPKTYLITDNWLNLQVVIRILIWTVIFLGIIWLLAPLLDRPIIQPIYNPCVISGYRLTSFPIWGYSILIRLLGSVQLVVVLQSLLGAFATAALMVRLNCLVPRTKILTTMLFILALPWFSYMAYAYQIPISSAFMLLMLLSMEQAILTKKIVWGIAVGVLGGIGQNFRSELFLLPGLMLFVIVILSKLQWVRGISVKPLLIAVGVAFIFQLPWAFNCYLNAGRFSFTESNLGHVLFVGLGKPESNPWKIRYGDDFAQETVNKAGLHCNSLSFEGSDFLKRKFIESIKQNPAAYLKCIKERILGMITQPFHTIALASTPEEKRVAIQIRNRQLLKWSQFSSDVSEITGSSGSSVNIMKILTIKLYELVSLGLGVIVGIFGIIGFLLALRTGPFKLNQPLILLLGIVILYRWGVNIAISGDSGKYMTSIYLCYLPFAINSVWYIYDRWMRFRKKTI